MAQAEFTLSAEIVPVVDPRSFERQLQGFTRQFNEQITKTLKPVDLKINEKGLEKVKEISKKVTDEIRTQFERIVPTISRSLASIGDAAKHAFEAARNATVRFTNALNLTNTKLLGYSRSIFAAIKENNRFKVALDQVNRSVGAIKDLPTSFKVLQAQILSGTSSLQRASDQGNAFAQSLLPLTTISTQISKGLDSVGSSSKQTTIAIERLANSLAPIDNRSSESVLNKQLHQLEASFKGLTRVGGTARKTILDTFTDARPEGVEALIAGLKGLRTEFPKATTDIVGQAFNMKTEVNRILLDLFPSQLSIFERFTTKVGLVTDKVKGFFKDISAGLNSALSNKANGDSFFNNFTAGIILARKETEKLKSKAREMLDAVNAKKGPAGGASGATDFTGGINLDLRSFKDKGITAGQAICAGIKQGLQDCLKGLDIPGLSSKVLQKVQNRDSGGRFAPGFTMVDLTKPIEDAAEKAKAPARKAGEKIAAEISAGTEAGITKKGGFLKALRAKFSEEGSETGSFDPLVLPKAALKAFQTLAAGATSIISAPFKALSTIISAPFKLLGGATKAAVAPVKLFGNVLNGATGGLLGGIGLAGGLTAAVTGLGVAALAAAAKFENIRISLDGIFTGNGKAALDEIAAFAAVTPFRLETAANAVIKLSSTFQGLQPTGALAILNQISGAAAAVGAGDDALNRVVIAFTQIQSAGRLTADNLRQITEAIPAISRGKVYENIAAALGKTNEQAKKLAEEGGIAAETALAAVLKTANEIPGAAEALDKQSKSFNGLLSTARDLFDQLLAKLGGPILRVAAAALAGFNIILTKTTDIVSRVSNSLGRFFSSLGFVTQGFKALAGVISRAPILGRLVKNFGDIASGSMKNFLDTTTGATKGVYTLQQAVDGLSPVKNSIDALNASLKPLRESLEASGAGIGKQLGPGIQGPVDDSLHSINALSLGFQELFNQPITSALAPQLKQLQELASGLNLSDAQKDAIENTLTAFTAQITKTNSGLQTTLQKVMEASQAFKALATANKAVAKAEQDRNDIIKEHNDNLAKEKLQLTKAQQQADQVLVRSTLEVADAQRSLNEALRPTPTEDLEIAELRLAQSKLQLKDLVEQEAAAQDKLNESQKTSINLTGLSLDQVRSRLRTVRASLAAQKATVAVDTKKSQTQVDIDALQAQIDKKSLAIQIRDTEKEIQELRQKGSEADPAVIAARKTIADAEVQRKEALDGQIAAQEALNKLDQKDIEFEKQLVAASEAIANAKSTAATAAEDAQIATLKSKGDEESINRIYLERINNIGPDARQLLKDSLTDTGEIAAAQELINQKQLVTISNQEFINRLLREATDTRERDLAASAEARLEAQFAATELKKSEFSFRGEQSKVAFNDKGKAIGVDLLTSNKFVNLTDLSVGELAALLLTQATGSKGRLNESLISNLGGDQRLLSKLSEALVTGPTSDILELFKRLFKELGLTFPGFAQGAVIDRPTPGVFGEAGREVILPLTRPARLMELLGNSKVLPPVLSALGRINLPSAERPLDSGQLAGLSLDPRRTRSVSQNQSAQEQAKRDRAFAKAIVAEMKEAGFTTGGATVTNTFTAPDAKDPLASVQIRQIAREVKRQLEKDL